jgi:Uma2 family endonuclease
MSTQALMTVEQFAQMKTADTEDYELVEGELIPLASATPKHARIRRRMERKLEDYFQANALGDLLGEVDCRLDAETVRRPDLSIFLNSPRLSEMDEYRIPIPFAPDIAVEVLSPSESAVDVRRKIREYLRGGTQEVWVIDHANAEVEIYTNGGIRPLLASDNVESPLLPGFSVSVAELIA